MPWWITVPAVLAVAIAAGYGALAVWIWWNGPRAAADLAAQRIAAESAHQRKAKARV
jgi:hypothetical protein